MNDCCPFATTATVATVATVVAFLNKKIFLYFARALLCVCTALEDLFVSRHTHNTPYACCVTFVKIQYMVVDRRKWLMDSVSLNHRKLLDEYVLVLDQVKNNQTQHTQNIQRKV